MVGQCGWSRWTAGFLLQPFLRFTAPHQPHPVILAERTWSKGQVESLGGHTSYERSPGLYFCLELWLQDVITNPRLQGLGGKE